MSRYKITELKLAEPRESTLSIDRLIQYASGCQEDYTMEPFLCLANEIKRLKEKVSELESKIDKNNAIY